MTVRAKQRQVKRGRGKPASAKVGDIQSVIDRIHQSEDLFDVDVANNLGEFYDILMAVAKGEKEISKDQLKVIDMCIKRAEALLDEYYADEDAPVTNVEQKKATVKESAQLISLVAKEA